MSTNITILTDTMINTLAYEAGCAGDKEMVVACRDAQCGNSAARELCATAINAARAACGDLSRVIV